MSGDHFTGEKGSSCFTLIVLLLSCGCMCPGLEVIKPFSYSTQLSTKFILLVHVNNC